MEKLLLIKILLEQIYTDGKVLSRLKLNKNLNYDFLLLELINTSTMWVLNFLKKLFFSYLSSASLYFSLLQQMHREMW